MELDGLMRPALPLARTDEARLAGARRAAESGDARATAEQFETHMLMALLREKEGNIKLLTGQTVQAKSQSWWTRLIGG